MKKGIPTQKQRVLAHLQKYGSIDSDIALRKYRIMNGLHARIRELKNEGYPIVTEMVTGKNEYGTWRAAKYVLIQPECQG